MPVGHGDYYGYKIGCCRVCGGCTDPWKCQEMKCQICSWYEFDEYTQKGRCTYIFQPQSHNEKLRGMLTHATNHYEELPLKSKDYYLKLTLDNPNWVESTNFLEKHSVCRLVRKVKKMTEPEVLFVTKGMEKIAEKIGVYLPKDADAVGITLERLKLGEVLNDSYEVCYCLGSLGPLNEEACMRGAEPEIIRYYKLRKVTKK